MMNLEDKIIAYLDGTLDEASRAELLHTLSVSPEKRKLLEEHIKLREIISLGHKPASVPLMTERKLADRIPVLLQELPYLAEKSTRIAPIVPVSSTSYFTLLGRQVSSFFTSRIGQVVSLGTLALIGGMSWYVAQTNDEGSSDVSAPTATRVEHDNTQALPSTSSSTSSSPSADRSLSSSIIDPSANDAVLAGGKRTSRAERSSNAGYVSLGSTKNTDGTLKLTSRTKDVSNSSDVLSRGNKEGIAYSDGAKTEAPRDAQNVDMSGDHSNADGAEQDVNKLTDKNSGTTDSATPSSNGQASDASKNIKDPNELPALPLPSKERNVTGRFVAQAEYSGSFTVRPNVKAQEYETTSGIGSPVLGLGYELNNKWAVGIEGGRSSLSQQKQERIETPQRAAPGPAGSQISVADRITYATDVKDVEALWGQATIRYTVNPNDIFRLELSGGAGAAFVAGIAPMVSLGTALTYDLGEVVAITGGVTARGAWLNGVNAPEEAVTTLGGGNAKAVVSHRPATNDLFSSSIAGRLGIRIGF